MSSAAPTPTRRHAADAPAPAHLAPLVRAFPSARILVVGDAVLDEWLEGRSRAVAREAPVPTVDVARRRGVPGGAANTAANVAALGGQARLLTVLGGDAAGDRLRDALVEAAVACETSLVADRRSTRAKRRVVAEGHVVARFDEGDTGPIDERLDAALARRLRAAAREADLVIVADYDGGVLAGRAVRRAVAAIAGHRPVLVDAHDPEAWREVRPTFVTPNWSELQRLGGAELAAALAEHDGDRVRAVQAVADLLLARSAAGTVVATLDGDGAVLLPSAGAAVHVPTRHVEPAHPSGAGDTMAAALALGLAVGADLATSAELAVAAATLVVQQEGTTVCTAEALLPAGPARVVPADQLLDVVAAHRRAGRRIVFTNGCFDVLHAGHVACLAAAAGYGDVLVVGVNDDAGVRAIKGPGRPVNGLADRAQVLAALGTVDHIVAFDGEAPLELIRAIRPEMYVKGADHDVERLPEARLVRELGGRVVTLPLLPDRSTAGVIAACASAAEGRAS